MRSWGFLRRAARALYWIGLAAVPFLGTATIVVAVFAIGKTLGLGFGIVPPMVIVAGLVSWTGLIRLYRALVPLPCRACGRAARVSSLNPVTIRCGHCGHVDEREARVLGAS